MKRLMIVFGILDLITVVTYAAQIPGYFRGLGEELYQSMAFLLVLSSLFASAYGFLRQRYWAVVLSYVQFPFRVAFAFLSFAWLAELIVPNNPSLLLHQTVWISAVALEGVRIGLTVMVHRGFLSQQPHGPSPFGKLSEHLSDNSRHSLG